MKQLAINGGIPVREKPFPVWPIHDRQEAQALTNVLESGKWWRGEGSEIEAFEGEFAAAHDSNYALAVTNGTHALELALATKEIGIGDEVIVPGLTFISTATAVFSENALAIPVDIDADTFCISADAILAAITPRTRAIIPVHFGGHICDMDRIHQIAKERGIAVIEDAAHAHGAEWNHQGLGKSDSLICFSFQSSKLMTAGEGGAILLPNQETWNQAFLVNNCGRLGYSRSFPHEVLASNYRMTEFQAALLRVQLQRLSAQIATREANAVYLDKCLQELVGITPQKRDPRVTKHSYYLYSLRFDSKAFNGLTSSEFVKALNAEGIPCSTVYPPIYKVDFFQNHRFKAGFKFDDLESRINCPVVEQLSKEIVMIPHYLLLGDTSDVDDIVEAIAKIKSASNAEFSKV
ncbi:MAG: DegT/DnrJ/EryC1/StrS family aminotransferase [Rivularia sp. (in: cyanobacteria)]